MSLLMIQHIPTFSLASLPCSLGFPLPGVPAADDIVAMVCDDVICSIIIMDFDVDVDSRGGVMELDVDCDIDVVSDIAGIDIVDIETSIDCVIEFDSDWDMSSDDDIGNMWTTDCDIDIGIVDIDDDIEESVTNKNEEQKEKLRSAFKNPNSYERIYVVLELIYSHFNPHTTFAIRRCLELTRRGLNWSAYEIR